MEHIIQSVSGAVSTCLMLVLVLTVVTNVVTEVVKKTCPKLPPNIVATVTALVLTVAALLALCQITGWPVTWYTVAAAVVVGFCVSYAAMFSFDKLRQTMEQLTKVNQSKE